MTATKNINRRMLAKELENQLREEICSGRFTSGEPILSAKKLAGKYGVSPLTANKAITNLVKEKLLYRRQGSGTFVSDNTDKYEKKLKIGLGFEQYDSNNPLLSTPLENCFQSICAKLKAKGHEQHHLSLRSLYDKNEAKEMLEELDGLLLLRRYINDWTLSLLEECGKPVVVFMHEEIHDLQMHQAVLDLTPGIRKALQYLQSSGNSGKIYLASRSSAVHSNRRDLFYRNCERVGIPKENISEFIINDMPGDQGRLAGQQIGEEILKHDPEPPVIFSTGGFVALGVRDKLLEAHGASTGTKLISIDDLESLGVSPEGKPVIASIRRNIERNAESAAELLLNRAASDDQDYLIVRTLSEFIPATTED